MAVDLKDAQAADQTYALFNPLDLYQTEVYQKLVKKVPYMSALSWLKMLKGRAVKRQTPRHVYSFYEEGQWMPASATIGSIAANGAKFDITLSAGDHGDIGGTGKSSFPVKNMLVVFADGKTQGFIESISRAVDSAHVITVKKVNSSQDIATVALAGTTMVFFSNAQPEESLQTESRVPQFEKITNVIQEIREGFKCTNFEMQNAAWFTTESGKRYLWYKGNSDTFQRFEFQKEAAMLNAVQSSALTDADGKAVQTMSGMNPQIDARGTVLEYHDTPDGDSLDEVEYTLDNVYGDTEYIVGNGHNLMVGLKNYLVDFAKNGTGGISFSPFDSGESQAIKLNFKYYSHGAFTYYFQQWGVYSHKDSWGATGLPHRNYGNFIPAGMTRDADPARPNGNPEYVPYLTMVSPEWGVPLNPMIDKGDHILFETGALANGGPTSDALSRRVHMACWHGFEMRCANKFLRWEKA